MRYLFVVLFSLTTLTASAVDFTKLSRSQAVSTTYPATFKCYVDVALFLKPDKEANGPLYLTVSYIIGSDTLNDKIKVEGNTNSVIKQLFLDEEERLTVSVRLNNENLEQVENIEGSLRIVRNPDFKPTDDQGKTAFLSGVWKSDQTPLFRIVNKDSVPQFFRLKMDFNEQFEYDKLFFKLKVISPSVGIQILEKSITIHESHIVDTREKSFSLDFKEIEMIKPGTYYFQVIPDMAVTRVNGVEKVNYEIVKE